MKYRTKLTISLVAVAFASIILGLVIFSTQTEKLVLQMLRSRSLSIAATSAVQLDPELVAKVNESASTQMGSYTQLRQILLTLLKANQRDDVYIHELYIVYPDPKDPHLLRFGAGSDPNAELPGTLYRYADKDTILKFKDSYYVNPFFITDQEGVWLSAFAPIRDQSGKYIASLVVDINAADIQTQLQHLIKYALIGLSSSLVLALVLGFFLSKQVTSSLDHLCKVVKEIGEGHLDVTANLKTNDEFGILATQINEMAKGLQERQRLKVSFARYVSHHVLDKILESETPLKLAGERRKVTVLFSDIRHFTKLAERLPPEEVVHLLNEYFEQMIEVIFSHAGTLDKFIGDGIMAEFGAPLDDKLQEEHALNAAIEMQKAMQKLGKKWTEEKRPVLQMGIGIHTGEAILGNIGSERRVEYTAIGDSVNVASRLEQATKILNVPILLSESTYLATKDKFPFKDLGSMTIPGRQEQIRVYTIDLETLI